MSCTQGRNRRWFAGILSAVGVNLFLLFFISLLFQYRTLPQQLTPYQPVPVWQVDHPEPKPESRPEKNVEPVKKTAVLPALPPVRFESSSPPKEKMVASIELPAAHFAIKPQVTGLSLSPLMQTAKPFYQPGELDHQPLAMATPAPLYPPRARMRGIEGKVRVRFLVDKNGFVKSLKIIQAEPDGIFERAVRTALKRWHFRPGVVGKVKVETEVETTIVFKLDH